VFCGVFTSIPGPMPILSSLMVATVLVAPATPPESRVEIVKLADGVYAATRKEAIGLAQNANSLIVVGDRDVLVVDAQFTREATLETLAAIRGVTRLPVAYVVNTHWHDDHFAGNQVYRDTFPAVQFIIHQNTRADLRSQGAPNRENTRTGAPPLVDKFTRQMAAGLGVDSTAISGKERVSLTDAIRIMTQYLAEQPGFRETMDGPSVQDRLDLTLGATKVEVRWLGRANTRGDLIVHLPRQRIVATGDVVVYPIPFAFGSFPGEWVTVLDSIMAMRPARIVPGHGPVLADLSYVRQVRAALNDILAPADAVAERRDSTAVALRTITLDRHRRSMAGDETWMNYMFEQFFRRPAVVAAVQQARLERAPPPQE